ncbi:erythropoietin isoform X2 [Erpetoichthys calabaricus]|uniref:erythropoietin isoform X2 n=1 Tax=Erpetoichthys calabaricus TaxID=27687 RepID=UPI00223448A7|nr:erythropoietin isoform X2 [Erpetoichthys calabaricus]
MGNRCTHGRSSKEILDYEDSDMGISRFVALLLMILGYTKPGKSSPLRPICDIRVMDQYIKEAKDAENAMKGCKEECILPEPLTLPVMNLNYMEWESKDNKIKEEEVQSGLSLLKQAILTARDKVASSVPLEFIEAAYRNIRNIGQILKSLNIQEFTSPVSQHSKTIAVRTLSELFRVQASFLRGKVRLLLISAEACRKEKS